MILFNDDIPAIWYGKRLVGPSFEFKVIGPHNCNSVEVEHKDGTHSTYPIQAVASALLKGTVTLSQ